MTARGAKKFLGGLRLEDGKWGRSANGIHAIKTGLAGRLEERSPERWKEVAERGQAGGWRGGVGGML